MTWETFMYATRALVIALFIIGLMLLQGCVSKNVLQAVSECNATQLASKSLKYQAMQGQMDAKDVTINILAEALAGDPCANMMTAEINGKNRLANSALLGGFAALPYLSNWNRSDNSQSTTTIGIEAATGDAGEGGGAGDITINTSVGGGVNTGTRQSADKAIQGGQGDFIDSDTVNSDGVF